MDEPPSSTTIIEIRNAGRGTHRLLVLGDGREFVFSDEAIERLGLRAGSEVTDDTLDALDRSEARVNAHDIALRLLSHRPRSQSEMRTRLAMRGIAPEAIDHEIDRLQRSGLLDDESFARAWVESRLQSAPRGRRMLRYELLGRGIDPEHVDGATNDIDDRETAIHLARVKARSVRAEDYEAFLGKVGPFLQRRGFDYTVAAAAARQAWEELQGGQAK